MENRVMNFETWKTIQVANRNIKEAESIVTAEITEVPENISDTPESTDTESKLDEGRMKDIDLISQESTSKEDFIKNLKEYLKEIGKPDLATDEFVKPFADDWKPRDEKEQE